ncbi:MAG: AraC family transcriptional regulator [Spirosomataceae bacterium]
MPFLRMFYRKFLPATHLKPYVECYFIWENNTVLSCPLTIESPPNGFASMVFNYGTPYRVTSQRLNGGLVAKNFLTGQATKSYQLQLSGTIGMVGIVFRPAGLNSLFGLPMYEYSDERANLRDVLGRQVDEYSDKIEEAISHTERIELLEQFLNLQLLSKNTQPDRTDYAANLIVDQYGVVNINDLMSDLFVCRRQFERKFLQKVGVSPKYYARIRRVGFLCHQLAQKRWQIADWQDLIYKSGYYDQSHFIKEFTEFTGKAPSLYVKNNIELAHYLTS